LCPQDRLLGIIILVKPPMYHKSYATFHKEKNTQLPHFTPQDLLDVKREYRANSKKLDKAVGTRWHSKYAAIEKKLNGREEFITRYVGGAR